MIRITRISRFTSGGAESASHVWQKVASQPGWITRAALVTFLIVIGLPIAILFLLAVLFAAAVFAVLAAFHNLWTRLRGVLPRGDGRENVIVRRVE